MATNGDSVVESPIVLAKATKYLTTIAICLECVTFGCAFNIFSPVLVDLKNTYSTDIETMSKVFTVLICSYLVGAIGGGLLFKYVIKRQYGVLIIFTAVALSLFIAPYCPTIIHLFVIVGVLGISFGAYDVAQTVWMIEIWLDEPRPLMALIQAQHFGYALGSISPSFLFAPYLVEEHNSLSTRNNITISNINSTYYRYDTTVSDEDSVDLTDSHLKIPFAIAASFALFNALCELSLIAFFPYEKPTKEIEKTKPNEQDSIQSPEKDKDGEKGIDDIVTSTDEGTGKPETTLINNNVQLIISAAIFLGFYLGMEFCTIQFIPTLAHVGGLKLSESEGALVLTGLTASFAVGRGFGILIALKVSPQLILCTNGILIALGNLVLLFWADASQQWLWAGCIILGFGFSTAYASFIAFIGRNLEFTDFIGALMLASGNIVCIIYPAIVGRFIELNPEILMYTNFLSITVCACSFAIAYCITAKNPRVVP